MRKLKNKNPRKDDKRKAAFKAAKKDIGSKELRWVDSGIPSDPSTWGDEEFE